MPILCAFVLILRIVLDLHWATRTTLTKLFRSSHVTDKKRLRETLYARGWTKKQLHLLAMSHEAFAKFAEVEGAPYYLEEAFQYISPHSKTDFENQTHIVRFENILRKVLP